MPKLGLSNLAFTEANAPAQLDRLANLGFSGVEVAPTRIAPWADLSEHRVTAYRDYLSAKGLSVPSLQAIFFGIDGVSLLGDHEGFKRMASHMEEVGRIGAALGAKVAVFGAPRQRAKGSLGAADAFALGVERLSKLAEVVLQYDMTIGLEPVPAAYGGDFLPSWQEVKSMVDTVGHPGLMVHLDVSCVELGGGSIAEAVRVCAGQTAHFHAAEPQLADFLSPTEGHVQASRALAETEYPGWVVVEMLESKANGDDPVATAAKFVNHVYAHGAVTA